MFNPIAASIVDTLERLFPRASISTNPADFAKAFNCLAEKTLAMNVSPELAFSVTEEFAADAVAAGVATEDELQAHYQAFKATHPWSTGGVAEYQRSLAALFTAKVAPEPEVAS